MSIDLETYIYNGQSHIAYFLLNFTHKNDSRKYCLCEGICAAGMFFLFLKRYQSGIFFHIAFKSHIQAPILCFEMTLPSEPLSSVCVCLETVLPTMRSGVTSLTCDTDRCYGPARDDAWRLLGLMSSWQTANLHVALTAWATTALLSGTFIYHVARIIVNCRESELLYQCHMSSTHTRTAYIDKLRVGQWVLTQSAPFCGPQGITDLLSCMHVNLCMGYPCINQYTSILLS